MIKGERLYWSKKSVFLRRPELSRMKISNHKTAMTDEKIDTLIPEILFSMI
jgi:hypothetical protein